MEIIPVLYLLKGKIVALYKGTVSQKNTYRKSPLEFAKEFENSGAHKIFIVDLDRSMSGSEENLELIKEIRKNVSTHLMFGGGVKSVDEISRYLDMGIEQVVLGVSAERVYRDAIEKHGADSVVVGIKAKGDEVVTDVKRDFPLRVIDFAETLPDMGVTQVLFKDIWKEGTQIGPNYDEPDRILRMLPLQVYYSGGISTEKHLKTLKDIGVKGAIIGKALYERELYIADIYESFL